jgi:polyhydroxyalkanoate synthase
LATDPDAWFAGATELAGSWWPDWQRWVAGQDGTTVPARTAGEGALPVIEDAPGSYVQVRAS